MSGTMRRQVTALISARLSPAAMSAQLAAFARTQLAETIARGDAPAGYETYVDGVKGAREEAVKPGGAIVYRFDLMGEAAVFAAAFLKRRSPQNSGPKPDIPFRDSFVIVVNGTPFRASEFDPQKMRAGATVWIYNPLPYARKVDVQLVGRKKLRFTVPPGMYDDAVAALNARFPTLRAERKWRLPLMARVEGRRGQRLGFATNRNIAVTRNVLRGRTLDGTRRFVRRTTIERAQVPAIYIRPATGRPT